MTKFDAQNAQTFDAYCLSMGGNVDLSDRVLARRIYDAYANFEAIFSADEPDAVTNPKVEQWREQNRPLWRDLDLRVSSLISQEFAAQGLLN